MKITNAFSSCRYRRCILIGMVCSTMAMTMPSGAQETSADPSQSEVLEEVTVWASRIPRSELRTATPVTVVGADELDVRGVTSFAELLNDLPAVSPRAVSFSVAGYSGISTVDLRGLGPNRTLVLVNGRRHVPSVYDGFVDLNVVPSIAIDRIEVVTGGASAAWGSDAIAGVANVIYDMDLDGIRMDVQAGVSERGDAEETRAAFAFGSGLAEGRGHLLVAGEYSKKEGAGTQADRSWSNQGYGIVANPADTGPSDGIYRLLITPDVTLSSATLGGLTTFPASIAGIDFGPGGVPQQFEYGTAIGPLNMIGGSGVRMSQYVPLNTPTTRWGLFTAGRYSLTPSIDSYFEASFSKSTANNPITAQFNFGNITINADNPFIPAELAATLAAENITSFRMGRLSTDFGFYEAVNERQTSRIVLGLEGKFLEDFWWDVYFQSGQTDTDTAQLNNRINQNFLNAVDAVAGPGGQVVCRSGAAGCVPLNLFGSGSPSAAAIAYVNTTSFFNREETQQVAAAEIGGDLFELWAGPLTVATGVEYRRETTETWTDPLSRQGALIFNNPLPAEGALDVTEFFGEAVLPILSDLPLAQSLELNAAVRLTDYSSIGDVSTWKVGAVWALTESLMFRGTISRDIRAPNLDELFRTGTTSIASPSDPCAAASQASNPVIAANCQQAGLPADFMPGAIVIPTIASGNINLSEEEADGVTVGAVFTPTTFAQGLRASIDWYDIDLQGVIGFLPVQTILTLCYGTSDDPSNSCSLIQRDSTGQLTQVDRAFLNVGSSRVRGVDFQLSQEFSLPEFFGQRGTLLNVRLQGTYLEDKIESVTGLDSFQQAGEASPTTSSLSTGIPNWRVNGSLDYLNGAFSLHPRVRYIGSAKYENDFGPEDINNNNVDEQWYVDLSARYRFDLNNGAVELYAGVDNLLDNDPPIAPANFLITTATNTALYDIIGRAFFAGITLKL